MKEKIYITLYLAEKDIIISGEWWKIVDMDIETIELEYGIMPCYAELHTKTTVLDRITAIDANTKYPWFGEK